MQKYNLDNLPHISLSAKNNHDTALENKHHIMSSAQLHHRIVYLQTHHFSLTSHQTSDTSADYS